MSSNPWSDLLTQILQKSPSLSRVTIHSERLNSPGNLLLGLWFQAQRCEGTAQWHIIHSPMSQRKVILPPHFFRQDSYAERSVDIVTLEAASITMYWWSCFVAIEFSIFFYPLEAASPKMGQQASTFYPQVELALLHSEPSRCFHNRRMHPLSQQDGVFLSKLVWNLCSRRQKSPWISATSRMVLLQLQVTMWSHFGTWSRIRVGTLCCGPSSRIGWLFVFMMADCWAALLVFVVRVERDPILCSIRQADRVMCQRA